MQSDRRPHKVAIELPVEQTAAWIGKVSRALKDADISPSAISRPLYKETPLEGIAVWNTIINHPLYGWIADYEAASKKNLDFNIDLIDYSGLRGPIKTTPVVVVFAFDDRDMALLFKLTWGGK